MLYAAGTKQSLRLITSAFSSLRVLLLIACVVAFGLRPAHSQCPDTGQTNVIKPKEGTGYYFYRFMGERSIVYFLDGKTFSMNGKDDPGKTFLFIDDMAYEPMFIEEAEVTSYVKSSKPLDILRAQATREQDYFKKLDHKMVITDLGPAARTNPDGSEDRLFYLWKKESAPGKGSAPQYLVSTVVKGGIFVLHFPDKEFRIRERYLPANRKIHLPI